MKVAAIIIARMGSTRLPGKSLASFSGSSLIAVIAERLRRFEIFEEIWLATSELAQDDPLAEEAHRCGLSVSRGSAEDVLARLGKAARESKADLILEVGGDCPFIDAGTVKQAIEMTEKQGLDYVTNVDPATYPDGLDIHLVRKEALLRADADAKLGSERKHPFGYFHRKKDLFRIANIRNDKDLSHIRLTLDYAEDLELLQKLYAGLYPRNPAFGLGEITDFLEKHPELLAINREWAKGSTTKETVPAYWLNSSYWKDSLQDLKTLTEEAFEAEKEKRYPDCSGAYSAMEGILNELKKRAEYLGSKN